MRNNSIIKIFFLAITVVFFTSCDKDFNTLGGDLIGDEHFGLVHDSINVLSYNQNIGPVQSNNLPVNPLGIYEDDVFGTTEASFATQVVLASVNPTIGNNVEIDSVTLSIPYFSHIESTNATTGNSTYVLDSIYGSADENKRAIKLSVYENGYFMRDLDPVTGFLESQKYYTNQGSDFDALKGGVRLNDGVVAQNDAFFFDKSEIKNTTTTTTDGKEVKTTTKTAPAMHLALNKTYFKTKIIDAAASGKLITNDVFKNYFRGLYFKVEKSGASPGQLSMMNFKAGTVTINYKEDLVTTVNGQSTTTRVAKSIVLNMTGNTVSLVKNTKKTLYEDAITTNVNKTAGDSRLYVKGGEGAMSVLELFDKTDVLGYDASGNVSNVPNNIPDELDELRRIDPLTKRTKMINEASLVFHVDKAAMGTTKLPNRIYLYDLSNSTVLLDYLNDSSTGTNAKNGQLIFGGQLQKSTDGEYYYKFRITEHIRNLVKNLSSKNVKLGVVVTEDIRNTTMNALFSKFTLNDQNEIFKIPQASVLNPLGVVLYGGAASVPDAKRLKLKIYYTKPN
ncbi:DUF4270 domain-containing protein [Flavobacterium nitratireducens]|uniref:DUF4270 domain-containing protein n=1 Tax=Flavobacterium nitratireducens TaxID=992289 RepID=UPI0024151D08|nr:DUF4270 domain-containing protein [Flavobacterium nitratireducens]